MRLGTLSATAPAYPVPGPTGVYTSNDPIAPLPLIGPIAPFTASDPSTDSTGGSIASGNIPFSQMTAAEQAAFLDANNNTGVPFNQMTAAQQAAFEAALGLGTNPTGSDPSPTNWALYLGVGILSLILLTNVTAGGR